MRAFRYAPDIPEEYQCAACGAKGVKLWREYQRIASCVFLRCCKCACDYEKKSLADFVDCLGQFINGDQIGWLVPAVPTEDGKTYWGYTSVPDAGVCWWKALPLEAAEDA